MIAARPRRAKRSPRQQLVRLASIASGCAFAVAALSQFIEPGGWVVWLALALLLVAIICLVRISAIFRRLEDEESGGRPAEASAGRASGSARSDEVCGDYPAPCNCDDPVTHGGHR